MFEAITEYETRAERRLMQKIEALLFVSDEPLDVDTLMEALGCDAEEVEMTLADLEEYLEDEDSALELREVAGGYQLFTKSEFHDFLADYLISQDRRKLSNAALEVLSIVAYCQPVTRSQISEIRGVNSDSNVTTLINKGFIFESGVEDSPGNPALLSTTEKFLQKIGVTEISELPPLESFAPDEETRISIAERLGALHETTED